MLLIDTNGHCRTQQLTRGTIPVSKEEAAITYLCLRSWDGQRVEFGHPAGRAAEAWDFADGRAVMTHLIETVALESTAGDRQFNIHFDVCTGLEVYGLRQFVVTTTRGTVTLEPLDLSYAAAFGMCSVFASDLRTPGTHID